MKRLKNFDVTVELDIEDVANSLSKKQAKMINKRLADVVAAELLKIARELGGTHLEVTYED